MRSPVPASLLVLLLVAAAGRAAEKPRPGPEKTRDKAALLQERDRAQREVAADPKNLAQWKRLAMISRHLGDEKAAEQALDKAAALDPKDAGVNFMRGLLYEKRGDAGKAAASYRACLDAAVQPKIKELCEKHLSRPVEP
jgi:cytochrome c-type biogenesis protein CcmH/NrfG